MRIECRNSNKNFATNSGKDYSARTKEFPNQPTSHITAQNLTVCKCFYSTIFKISSASFRYIGGGGMWLIISILFLCLPIQAQNHKLDVDTSTVKIPIPDVASLSQPFSDAATGHSFCMTLKTNLLYDALLVPNIGAEFHLGRNFTVGANLHFAWWNTDSWFWRTYGAELAVRKYFGSAANMKPMTGHHLGIYGQALTYDFLAFGKTGYMSGNPSENLFGRASWAVGIEYGYSLPITRRLNLDFVIGLGYQGGKYNEYEFQDDCYVWKALKNRRFFGPTKAEVTLVWLLGKDNYNRKGGSR